MHLYQNHCKPDVGSSRNACFHLQASSVDGACEDLSEEPSFRGPLMSRWPGPCSSFPGFEDTLEACHDCRHTYMTPQQYLLFNSLSPKRVNILLKG